MNRPIFITKLRTVRSKSSTSWGQSIAEGQTWLGDYIFEDINKDGIIDNKDQTFIGNPEPKFTYGIRNTFSWKGFDLTIFLSGSYGNDVLNYNRRWLEISGSNSNLLKSTGYAIVEKIDPNGPVTIVISMLQAAMPTHRACTHKVPKT